MQKFFFVSFLPLLSLVVNCQTPATHSEPGQHLATRTEACTGAPAIQKISIKNKQIPTFISGLWADTTGALGAIVGDGGEGQAYLPWRWQTASDRAQLIPGAQFSISVDDAVLLDGVQWVPGSISEHDLGQQILAIPIGEAQVPATVLELGDLPPLHNWRFLRGAKIAYGLMATARPIAPALAKSQGAVLVLFDAQKKQIQQVVWLAQARSCSAGFVAFSDDKGAWQAQLSCMAQDNSALLLQLENKPGKAPTIQKIDLSLDDKLGEALAACLGARVQSLPDICRAGQQIKVALCRDDDKKKKCAVASLDLEQRLSSCLRVPKSADPSIDRLHCAQDGRVLAASRSGGLWQFSALAKSVQTLREPKKRSQDLSPRPAFSFDGRFVLFGQHALEPGQQAMLWLVATDSQGPSPH